MVLGILRIYIYIYRELLWGFEGKRKGDRGGMIEICWCLLRQMIGENCANRKEKKRKRKR